MMMEDTSLGLSGWLCVAVYVLVAWLCLRAFMAEKTGPRRPYLKSIAALYRVVRKHWPQVPTPARRAGLWVCLALVLLVLGLNRLFDLESLVLDLWREDARTQGTYGERRAMQGGFIGAVAIMGLAVVVVLFRVARGQLADFRLVLGGAVFLLAFVVIRAASLHAVDGILDRGVAGVRVGVGLELLGLGIIAAAALGRLRRARAAAGASGPAPEGRRPAPPRERLPGGSARPRAEARPQEPARPRVEAPVHGDESAPIRITQLR